MVFSTLNFYLGIRLMYRYFFLFLIFLLTSCTNYLFVPVKAYPVTPDAVDMMHEDVYIRSVDGLMLHGWKLFAEKKTAGTILFFHGNGDNVSTQLPNTFWLPREGYDVYVFDYRGYGESEGIAELDTTIRDMESMIAYVAGQLPEDEKLIVIGHSLGGSMAIYSVAHSAYRDRIKALVTVEAFSDYHDVTQDVLSKSWLFWLFQWPLSFTIDNTYRPLDSVALITPIPILILHSKSDEMIDMYHADRLFEAAGEPKMFALIDSNHSNIFIKPQNRKVLLDYFSKLH
ncbi:MAG TPA: alpha/beta fold hydrolase [Gammaproteobacteria bacterium]|nr:alpha/beta fold hydrolase [Gammaproteobacteria bacterium]